MAYGIRATASGGEFQIDSSLSTTKHLAVHSKGYFTGNTGKLVIDIGDVVFARAYNSNGTVGVNINKINETVDGVSYAAGRVYTFAFPVDWVRTKPSTNSSAYSTAIASTDYGIQVKNATGAVCFDSRIVNFGFDIIQIHGRNTMAGLGSGFAGYNSTNNTVFAGAANTFNVSHASHRKIYVSIFGAEYDPNVLSGTTHMSFKYNSSSNKIFYEGWVAFNLGSGDTHLPFQNQSEILVGELTE